MIRDSEMVKELNKFQQKLYKLGLDSNVSYRGKYKNGEAKWQIYIYKSYDFGIVPGTIYTHDVKRLIERKLSKYVKICGEVEIWGARDLKFEKVKRFKWFGSLIEKRKFVNQLWISYPVKIKKKEDAKNENKKRS